MFKASYCFIMSDFYLQIVDSYTYLIWYRKKKHADMPITAITYEISLYSNGGLVMNLNTISPSASDRKLAIKVNRFLRLFI